MYLWQLSRIKDKGATQKKVENFLEVVISAKNQKAQNEDYFDIREGICRLILMIYDWDIGEILATVCKYMADIWLIVKLQAKSLD